MPNILALFALFSIGSAAAIGCTKDAGYCTTAANVIGYCLAADSTCDIDTTELCKNKNVETVCGKGLFQGKCVAGSPNTCVFNKTIKVDYELQVTTGETAGFKTTLASAQFKLDLAKEFNRNISNVYPSCDGAEPELPGNATRMNCPSGVSRKFFGTMCPVECSSGFAIKKLHGTACGNGGNWDEDKGECAKACPLEVKSTISGVTSDVTGALASNSLDTVEFAISGKGTLSCNIFSGEQECSLGCTPVAGNTYISTGTTLKCDTSATTSKWTGTVGVCRSTSSQVSGTLAVVLNGTDLEAELTASGSSTNKTNFQNDFKQKIALVIPGISPENVKIINIREVPASVRRLNAGDAGERSVLVDYTIVGPPQDAAELVPPRVLRGIP